MAITNKIASPYKNNLRFLDNRFLNLTILFIHPELTG
jgi:hypothetical protein